MAVFDALKDLAVGDMLTIDDPLIQEYAAADDFTVAAVRHYSHDEGEVVVVDLDDVYLVGHTLAGQPRYFVYELNAAGDDEDLEAAGFRPVYRDDGLPHRLYVRRAGRETPFKAVVGPVDGLSVDRNDADPQDGPDDAAVCLYRGRTRTMSHALVERLGDDLRLYQGFHISGKNILL